jgi:hypothetical protein
MMLHLFLAASLAVCAAGAGTALDDSLTVGFSPWIEVLHRADQPASLFCAPSGQGWTFAGAMAWGGARTDATLEVVLWSDEPGWGDPVPFFPAEDMWLASLAGGLTPCAGGTVADADTDAAGRTTWAAPLRTGGQADPDAGDDLRIMVNGEWAHGAPDLRLRLNSADLNGDGTVNLTDVSRFVDDLHGNYDYRSDFRWDGVINISDVGIMTAVLGSQCP